MIRLFFIFLLVLIIFPLHSQDFKKYYAVVWDVNQPLSNKDFVNNTSTRGGRFIYRESINNRFSVGGDLGFATYHDHLPPQVYASGNGSIYAELFTYVYNYSLSISGEYYFTEAFWLKPFAGFGIGASFNRYSSFYNVYGDTDRVWGALFRPHAGALIRFGNKSRWAARVSAHYDWATTRSENFGYKNFSNLGADVGIVFMFK